VRAADLSLLLVHLERARRASEPNSAGRHGAPPEGAPSPSAETVP
jgi:hypothetical protein